MALLLLLNAFALGTFRVAGASMEDTFEPGDVLIVSKLKVTGARISGYVGAPVIPVARGDAVIFRFPRNRNLALVKRVIGIPGDHVRISDGRVVVSSSGSPGQDMDDPAISAGARLKRESGIEHGAFDGIVPSGAVFVLGDNRVQGASSDSRDWGYLPLDEIIGTPVIRLLPIQRAAWL